MSQLRIGVDTGGTFSDFVVFDESSGEVEIFKENSTPAAPEQAILTGIDRLLENGGQGAEIAFFSHGTTVATNALLEGKGARAGLVVTEGFRGIYEVQEQARPYGPATFDLFYRRPPLLVPPRRTVEVRERTGADGEVVTPFDDESARIALRALKEWGVDSIAVCFLFSFLNPDHERRVRVLAADILPGVPVSLSCELCPFIREYYRLSTTVINAYLEPVVSDYLGRLDAALGERGVDTPQRYVMLSHGGVTPVAAAGSQAVSTLLSGLAGGVIAAGDIAAAAAITDAITFDMGGTSCDVAVIVGGDPERRARAEIEGRHIALPSLGVDTLSAGGGTIARVDTVGLLEVGPESAGADPGPACYGRGGQRPTVTDANLVLGYLGPETALAGRFKLDLDAARHVIDVDVAAKLDLSVEAAALGILRLIDVKMGEAVRAIVTRRGLDMRDFTLIAFGGAGPLHAARIASELGIARVLVPAWPGVTSALGLLSADVRCERARSQPAMLDELPPEEVSGNLAQLADEVTGSLRGDRFSSSDIVLLPAVDLRYEGQGYELTVPIDGMSAGHPDLSDLRARFDSMHRMRYGHGADDARVELMSYRVAGIGRVAKASAPAPARRSQPVDAALVGTREMIFEQDGVPTGMNSPVYDRARLGPGHRFAGPAVVEQSDSTTLVLPGQRATVTALGAILIETAAVGPWA